LATFYEFNILRRTGGRVVGPRKRGIAKHGGEIVKKQWFTRALCVAVGILLVLVLTSCGDSSETTETSSSGNVTTSAADSGTPKYGGTLRMAGPGITPTLGWPAEMGNSASGVTMQACLETLFHQDNEGNIVPWLAESYTVADDLKSVTIKLRTGVKFHDGSDFNAEVCKWNLEQFMKLNPHWDSVEVVDDYTVKLNLKNWKSTTVADLADSAVLVYMVSKVAYDTNGLDWMKSNPVGTGPFVFESYAAGSSLKFVRNDAYWGKDEQGQSLPYLDAFEVQINDDKSSRQAMLLAGQTEWIASVEPGRESATYVEKGYQVYAPCDVVNMLIPDTTTASSPWKKKEVREAVEYAIDREALAESLGAGEVEAVNQIPPVVTTAYNSNFTLARAYDPAKAKELLAAAGYPDGFKTTLILSPVGVNRELATAVQGFLAQVGIEATIETPAVGPYFQYNYPGTFPANSIVISGQPAVDVSFLGGINFMLGLVGTNWERPAELTAAVEAANASPTLDAEKVQAVTDIITRDALLIPVLASGSGTALQTYVKDTGLTERGTINCYNLERTWLDQ
jgi:peptide/nickel transport system substrate-binding protein